jgi:hypothetical protein
MVNQNTKWWIWFSHFAEKLICKTYQVSLNHSNESATLSEETIKMGRPQKQNSFPCCTSSGSWQQEVWIHAFKALSCIDFTHLELDPSNLSRFEGVKGMPWKWEGYEPEEESKRATKEDLLALDRGLIWRPLWTNTSRYHYYMYTLSSEETLWNSSQLPFFALEPKS